MAWRRIRDNPLSEPILIQLSNIYAPLGVWGVGPSVVCVRGGGGGHKVGTWPDRQRDSVGRMAKRPRGRSEQHIAMFNTLRPGQNGRHFADDIFKLIFLNENVRISIKTSLKFVPRAPINNIPALVQIMAWRRPGDKPLSEPMMVSWLTHIFVTRPQWVISLYPRYLFETPFELFNGSSSLLSKGHWIKLHRVTLGWKLNKAHGLWSSAPLVG